MQSCPYLPLSDLNMEFRELVWLDQWLYLCLALSLLALVGDNLDSPGWIVLARSTGLGNAEKEALPIEVARELNLPLGSWENNLE